MLGFGTKKPAALDRFPTESWSVAKAIADGAPLILRINIGARKYVAHPELPTRLGVTVDFNVPNEHGFCSSAEGEQLSNLEDALTAALLKQQAGFPVLAVTTAGKREFIYYVRDEQSAGKAVESVRSEGSTHKLEYGFERDAEWSYFKQFV